MGVLLLILKILHDLSILHSRKLTWKPKKGPVRTTVLLKGDYMRFHVSLGECIVPYFPRYGVPRVMQDFLWGVLAHALVLFLNRPFFRLREETEDFGPLRVKD